MDWIDVGICRPQKVIRINSMKKNILILIILLHYSFCPAQTWPKIFGQYEFAWSRDVVEMYDKGYLVAAQLDPGYNVTETHTWLIKTDINGELLWDKRIFNSDYWQYAGNISISDEGEMLLIGSTGKFDVSDPYISKYNPCFQQEWCTILSSPGSSDYGKKILATSDGYIALLSYYHNDIDERVSIVKLDMNGNVEWHKVYLQDDPGFYNEESRDIMVTPDGGFLLTTDVYYDPDGSGYGYLHPALIKTDSLGAEEWITVWGLESNYLGVLPLNPGLNSDSTVYYSTSTHYISGIGFTPGFIKTSLYGEEMFYADLISGSESAIASTIHFLYPDTLIMACGWGMPGGTLKEGVIKCDTNANAIQSQVLLDDVDHAFRGSTLTFDNKMVLTGGFIKNNPTPDIYLFKVNSNLELDTLYTTPFEYDYLCPDPIPSDTIDLVDCGIYTKLHDPDKEPDIFNLKAYPVPAEDFITVELPGELLLEKVMNGITIKTVFHQWDKTKLQVINMQGTIVAQMDIPSSEKQTTIDCHTWKPGMYAVRLIFRGYKVGEVKVLIL